MIKKNKSQLQVSSYLIDFNQYLSPHNLFSLMQDCAWKHITINQCGWDHLYKQGRVWVLSRMLVTMERPILWQEEITVETWMKSCDLITSYRDFTISDSRHQIVARATSMWHQLDVETRKIMSLNDFVFPNLNQDGIEEKPQKLHCPTGEPLIDVSREINASNIDMNGHANNTNYIRWALDAFPIDFLKQKFVKQIAINFLVEGRLGNHFHVETRQESDDTFFQQIIRNEDHVSLANIKSCWENIKM